MRHLLHTSFVIYLIARHFQANIRREEELEHGTKAIARTCAGLRSQGKRMAVSKESTRGKLQKDTSVLSDQ